MKRYLAAMQSLATAPAVLFFFFLFLGIYSLLNYTALPFSIPSLQEVSAGKTILNVLPHYDAATAYDHIDAYGPKGIRVYYRILVIDLLALIPIYLAFLTTGLLHAGALVLGSRGQSLPRVLAVLPLLAAVLNLLEDGIVVFLIEAYPHRYDAVATVAGFITSMKSILIVVSLLTTATLYFIVGYSRTAYFFGLRKCHI